MNKAERIAELKRILTTPADQLEFKTFDEIHKRIEEIMERPVWTHEMAFLDMLIEEIELDRKGETFLRSLREIAKTKPVIGIVLDKDKPLSEEDLKNLTDRLARIIKKDEGR